jgi:iron complex transport system substrate-binding protein
MTSQRPNPPEGGTTNGRIVSLLPSATEIVAALGFRDCLVGRSHECDFPPGVETLRACCEPTIDISAPSGEINSQVEERLASAVSIYRLDTEKIAELKPTLILTQMQCEVCAVSENDVRATVEKLADSKPQILSLSPSCLVDLWQNIRDVASALGVAERGESLVAQLQSRLDDIRNRTSQCQRRPTVACIEWLDPLMTAGNWIPELVEIAGGENLLGRAGEHSPWLKWDELIEADPDVIVVLPCGFDLARTREESTVLTANPRWNELRAVQDGAVFLADGHQFFNRPGPRLVESAAILAEMLYPEIFPATSDGWAKMTR